MKEVNDVWLLLKMKMMDFCINLVHVVKTHLHCSSSPQRLLCWFISTSFIGGGHLSIRPTHRWSYRKMSSTNKPRPGKWRYDLFWVESTMIVGFVYIHFRQYEWFTLALSAHEPNKQSDVNKLCSPWNGDSKN